MKLREQKKDVTVLGEQEAPSEFSIRNSSKMFKILSDGLYSDKHLAVIRELVCNAFDAHIEAEQDKPVQVHLPSMLSPTLSIKDFGTGLSHEDVTTLYTTYGASTKDDTNLFIGALGLGSKSPFAYTDNFTVESIYEGKKSTYNCYLNHTTVPIISRIDEENTDEHNGLTISLAVQEEDIKAFEKAAKKVALGFEEGEIEWVGLDIRSLPEPSKIFSDGTKVFKPSELEEVHSGFTTNPVYAKMGKILYPVDKDQLLNNVKLEENLLEFFNKIYETEYHYGYNSRRRAKSIYLIPFEIGDLDISASRESLSYDKPSLEKIKERVNNLYTTLIEDLNNQINSATTVFEKAKIITEINTKSEFKILNLNQVTDIKEHFKHNDFIIPISLKGCALKDDHMYSTPFGIAPIFSSGMGQITKAKMQIHVTRKEKQPPKGKQYKDRYANNYIEPTYSKTKGYIKIPYDFFTEDYKSDKIFCFTDHVHMWKKPIQKYCEDNDYKPQNCKIFYLNNRAQFDKFIKTLEEYGIPTDIFVHFDELPKVPRAKKGSVAVLEKGMPCNLWGCGDYGPLNPRTHYGFSELKSSAWEDPEKIKHYVVFSIDDTTVQSLVTELAEYSDIWKKVWAVAKSNEKFLKARKDAKNITDIVPKALEALHKRLDKVADYVTMSNKDFSKIDIDNIHVLFPNELEKLLDNLRKKDISSYPNIVNFFSLYTNKVNNIISTYLITKEQEALSPRIIHFIAKDLKETTKDSNEYLSIYNDLLNLKPLLSGTIDSYAFRNYIEKKKGSVTNHTQEALQREYQNFITELVTKYPTLKFHNRIIDNYYGAGVSLADTFTNLDKTLENERISYV